MFDASVCNMSVLNSIAAQIPTDPSVFPPQAAHVVAIAFDDGNNPEVLAEAGSMLPRGRFNPGLMSALRLWSFAEIKIQYPSLGDLDVEALKTIADESITIIPGHFQDAKYLDVARTMIRASLAVYELYPKYEVDQRDALEGLLRQHPNPLLRMPALSILTAHGIMVFWGRCGVDLIHDDLFSNNPNRHIYAMREIEYFAGIEEELSGSQTNSIRSLAYHLPDLDALRNSIKIFLRERSQSIS